MGVEDSLTEISCQGELRARTVAGWASEAWQEEVLLSWEKGPRASSLRRNDSAEGEKLMM